MNVYYDNQFWSNQKLLISVHLETLFLCITWIFIILKMEKGICLIKGNSLTNFNMDKHGAANEHLIITLVIKK